MAAIGPQLPLADCETSASQLFTRDTSSCIQATRFVVNGGTIGTLPRKPHWSGGARNATLQLGLVKARLPPLRLDIWGQTVNVAQLMESKSGGNCILVSESTRWRLRDYFTFETVPDVQTKSGHAVHAYRLVLDRSRDPYD